MMNTRTKLHIARALYRTVMGFRRLLGRTDSTLVTRRGIHWQLDLREGIDLAIYLFGCFEYDTVRAYRKLLKPGNTVLDIGANIGAHTLPMARCVYPAGRVVAFASRATCEACETLASDCLPGARFALGIGAASSVASLSMSIVGRVGAALAVVAAAGAAAGWGAAWGDAAGGAAGAAGTGAAGAAGAAAGACAVPRALPMDW